MATPKSTEEFYEIKVPVDNRILHSLFTTACEGGINYWAAFESYHWRLHAPDGTPDLDGRDDIMGFYADIIDNESDEDPAVIWRIDREVMKRGLYLAFLDPVGTAYVQRAIHDCVLHPDEADYDADVADIVVQYGLFGEVVYG